MRDNSRSGDWPKRCASNQPTEVGHHKHVPPDIRHHRIPAPGMSFVVPNLPGLLREIETIVD